MQVESEEDDAEPYSSSTDIGKQSRPRSDAADQSRPVDKDGIFLGQYGLIVSLFVPDATVSVGPSLCSVPTEWSVSKEGTNCCFS